MWVCTGCAWERKQILSYKGFSDHKQCILNLFCITTTIQLICMSEITPFLYFLVRMVSMCRLICTRLQIMQHQYCQHYFESHSKPFTRIFVLAQPYHLGYDMITQIFLRVSPMKVYKISIQQWPFILCYIVTDKTVQY